jgi:hypothetical protein
MCHSPMAGYTLRRNEGLKRRAGRATIGSTGGHNKAGPGVVLRARLSIWPDAICGTTQCCLPLPSGRAREGMSEVLCASTRPAAQGCVTQLSYSRCCGIDFHKDSVRRASWCTGIPPSQRFVRRSLRRIKKRWGICAWLHANQVTQVAMESTVVYWKPVWQGLEGNFDLILANPYQIKTMPGRKTDARDSQRIAELLAHGIIRYSFVPPRPTRDLAI